MSRSLIQRLVDRDGSDAFLAGLSPEELRALPYWWEGWSRPEQQLPEGDWRYWLVQAGRGWGKTRVGAEFAKTMAKQFPGSRGALVAETPAQARDVMVLGESGIMACSPPDERPEYLKSERLIRWPNGSMAHLYSAFAFEELRGPQHGWAWCDELAKWRHPSEAFDQLNFGLRLGVRPRCLITTTPRPITLLRKLQKDPRCVITRGSTFDNEANLPEDTLEDFKSRYQGTRLGRQELGGELLEDVPGALWRRGPMIDAHRQASPPYVINALGEPATNKSGQKVPKLDRIVVGVDPTVAANEDVTEEEARTDVCGIVVAGRAGRGRDAQYYVLDDRSVFGSPEEWAKAVVAAWRWWEADLIVPEENQGGALVTAILRQVEPRAKVKGVHASRGKVTRAEPISLLYEQGRVHHCGLFDELEDEMCTYVPGMDSPDRMDALVWAMTELSEAGPPRSRLLVG